MSEYGCYFMFLIADNYLWGTKNENKLMDSFEGKHKLE